MQTPAIPSIDQLLVLLVVAEAGSFSAAAKRLGRATSAISYAIDTLEAQLGLSLFDRGTTRKPKLTQQGEAIVSEAKAVAHSVETLRARVRGFLDELEPEVSLVVDSMLPSDRLTALLREFHGQFPSVPVRLLVQTLGGVERVVRNGHARIGVGSQLHMDMTGFHRNRHQRRPGHSRGGAQSSAGQGERSCSTAGSRFRPACSCGATRGGEQGFWGRQPQHLAHRRSSSEAQASSRRTRVGRNAGTGRSGRYRVRKARALEPS